MTSADGQPRAGDFRKAYSTPLIVDFQGQKLMLTVGSKAAYSYDPATGKEIWKLNHADSRRQRARSLTARTPSSTGNGQGEMLCVRGRAWRHHGHACGLAQRARLPRMPSPVLAEDCCSW